MKTLVKDGCSLYLFSDYDDIVVTSKSVIVGSPPLLVISDCNTANSVLYDNVTPPEDWYGRKYIFDGTAWAVNPDFVDPLIGE